MSFITYIKERGQRLAVTVSLALLMFGMVGSVSACGYYRCWHRHYHYYHYHDRSGANLAMGLVAGALIAGAVASSYRPATYHREYLYRRCVRRYDYDGRLYYHCTQYYRY